MIEISKEFTGNHKRTYVVRFKGVFIESFDTLFHAFEWSNDESNREYMAKRYEVKTNNLRN